MNNMQLPQEEVVKNLGLHLDRGLTWHKHILPKENQQGIALTKVYCLLERKSKPYSNNELLIYKKYSKQSGFPEYNSGVRLSIESHAHDSGSTLVCAEYG
jgi:hypothetical protein